MQCNEHAYETHAYLPRYFAVTLSMYTLIPTVYRALQFRELIIGLIPLRKLVSNSMQPALLPG